LSNFEEEEELEPLAYILLAARVYLTLRYTSGDDKVPPYVLSAYSKLIKNGPFVRERSLAIPELTKQSGGAAMRTRRVSGGHPSARSKTASR